MPRVAKVQTAASASILIELPANERGLPAREVERFDKARADLLNPRLALREDQRETRARIIAAIEERPKAEAERAWLKQSAAETMALAQARGEDVRADKGRVRIVSRGGLKQAYEDGHLNQAGGKITSTDLYEAGQRYRTAYEATEGMTTGQREGSGFSGRAPQVRIVEAGLALQAMRALITDRQRAVLDLVCGKDIRLRTAATELRRGFPSAKNSLRGGLLLLVGLKVEKPKALAEALSAKTAAITKAQNAA